MSLVKLVDDKSTDLGRKWVEGNEDISAWNPPRPEGDNWILVMVCEHDEGPFALWVRPAVEKPLTGKAFAQEFLLGSLIKATMKHIKTLSKPWGEMKEMEQRRVLGYVQEDCQVAARDAIDVIASNARLTFPAHVEQVVFKDGVKAVLTLAKTPEAHSLADAEGSMVTIVIEDRSRLLQEGDALHVDKDQKALFDAAVEASQETMPEGDDPLYEDAVAIVRKQEKATVSIIQSHLRIGYNRVARLLEKMEEQGVVTPMDASGVREIVSVPA